MTVSHDSDTKRSRAHVENGRYIPHTDLQAEQLETMSPQSTQELHISPSANVVPVPREEREEESGGGLWGAAIGKDDSDTAKISGCTSSKSRTKKSKSLASGWKSIAWAKPAADSLNAVSLPAEQKQKLQATVRTMSMSPMSPMSPNRNVKANVSQVDLINNRAHVTKVERGDGQYHSNPSVVRRSWTEEYLAGNHESADDARQQGHQHSTKSSLKPTSAGAHTSERQEESPEMSSSQSKAQRHTHFWSGTISNSKEETGHQKSRGGGGRPSHSSLHGKDEASGLLFPHVQPITVHQHKALDDMHNSCSRRVHVTDPCEGEVRLERSLSDTSIVPGSDFGLPKANEPTIVTEISDKDAISGLIALCSQGKGLELVKHAGSGGGKSRKFLKYVHAERVLMFCGMRPPYFKTKIAARDIDRAEAKWCCVVVHAKGRSPLRLEVASINTAAVLKAGLMAASRLELEEAVIDAKTPPSPSLQSDEDAESTESEIGLSSVRPGHRPSAIYDPDAALSVAALLAKEMEEERAMASQGLSAANSAMRPTHAPESVATMLSSSARNHATTIRRSASFSSVASSRMTDATADTTLNRRSLPRYGGAATAEEVGSVVNPDMALRRLRAATEGRGLGALKRRENGKRGSRVMVRCRIEAGTIGWAHVLPPFTRKNLPAKDLLGASRSMRVVTITFREREPVLLETDRLTDAIILEQGFTCLAKLVKPAS